VPMRQLNLAGTRVPWRPRRAIHANGRRVHPRRGAVGPKGTLMIKRSFVRFVVSAALLLSPAAATLVTAPPAAASVTNCGAFGTYVIQNSDGALGVRACVRHTAGHYYSYADYFCWYWTGSVWTSQYCNIAATQHLWYNATLMRSDDVGGVGIEYPNYRSDWHFSGSPAGCTSAQIHSQISNIRVRFASNSDVLHSTSATRSSYAFYGSLNC
jgi:hypothetical protein